STISFALILAVLMWKILPISSHLATLIGVGTSICGGSAIAATAPVIQADDEDVAQAISVIFLFNVLAALIFPTLATWLGFSTDSGQAFGMF
ncbi:putative sulfate exporter family transporter, partial [Streptococcus suis]